LTQARSNSQARAHLKRQQQAGATRKEALRCLKRRLSDVIYRAMLTDAAAVNLAATNVAA
jgi:ribosomal protein S4